MPDQTDSQALKRLHDRCRQRSWPIKVGLTLWAVLLVWPVVYFFTHLSDPCDSKFVDNATGNWFATIAGVIAGIPIALWIERKREERVLEDMESERASRRLIVFEAIYRELRHNRALLNKRQYTVNMSPIPIQDLHPPFRAVSWTAFQQGGELQHVSPAALIEKLASAYYYIDALRRLEDSYLSLIAARPDQVHTLGDLRITLNKLSLKVSETSHVAQLGLQEAYPQHWRDWDTNWAAQAE